MKCSFYYYYYLLSFSFSYYLSFYDNTITMLDQTKIKKVVFDALLEWNYNEMKASAYNIAKKLGFSEPYIYRVLRELKSVELITNSRGSWHVK